MSAKPLTDAARRKIARLAPSATHASLPNSVGPRSTISKAARKLSPRFDRAQAKAVTEAKGVDAKARCTQLTAD